MSSIKKVLSIILILALALMSFGGLGGCQKEAKPLRIYIEGIGAGYAEGQKKMNRELLEQIKAYGGPEDVEIENYQYTDEEAAEGKSTLTRIRTEMMAGEGPDVFLIGPSLGWDQLFLMPEKSMDLGLFMPLDDYLDKAQFMEPDRLIDAVVQAGYNEKYGQVLMPLSYQLPVTVFRKEDVSHTPSTETVWQDMLADETGVLQSAAGVYFHYDSDVLPFGRLMIDQSLGTLADYSQRKLTFTEEEMLQRFEDMLALVEKYHSGELDQVPDHYYAYLGNSFQEYNQDSAFMDRIPNFSGSDQDFTFIPVYSDDGGVTATVDYFVAINGNTKRPDDAFFILDMLMDPDFQQEASIITEEIFRTDAPVYEDLMTKEHPLSVVSGLKSSGTGYGIIHPRLGDSAAEEYAKIRACITNTQIDGQLNMEMNSAVADCIDVYNGAEGSIEDIVHRAYRTMALEIDE